MHLRDKEKWIRLGWRMFLMGSAIGLVALVLLLTGVAKVGIYLLIVCYITVAISIFMDLIFR